MIKRAEHPCRVRELKGASEGAAGVTKSRTKRQATARGRRLERILTRRGSWTPPRPRLTGALLALAGGAMVTAAGVLAALLHNAPQASMVGYAALVMVSLMLLLTLGMPSEKRMLGLALLWVLLLLMVPNGFRSAVLDWRGEHVRATVTEVKQEDEPRTGGVDYQCKAETTQGRALWLRDSDQCGRDTRPGDRYEIVRDPDDLVGASTSTQPISFTALVPGIGGTLLLMAAIGARSVSRSPSATADRAPAASR
ncbi:hypothetical protein [Streptomyces sp. NPDC050145]|uniref:hypothetical protein n=1 Tax=Streptomyces sp. NPDC050145 TaxID=3365602 RepID=UPI003792EDA5